MLITAITHPDYETHLVDWTKWRRTYNGGQDFIDAYLRQLSKRESEDDFKDRKAVTYCPAFAKAAVNEIKDSIYQRMSDISRSGGSKTYNTAISGLSGGVDLEGSSMNYFMGCKVLPELLTMEKVGIFVDMPPLAGESIAHNSSISPYIYMYKAEDLRCWIIDENDDPNEFAAVLLREYVYINDEDTGFPNTITTRYRRVWRDINGIILAAFYNEAGEMIDKFGNKVDQPTLLNIERVPFTIVRISESLMTDIADYQIALLNLASTDMSYALKSNYPFYTEQTDNKATSPHLVPQGQAADLATAAASKSEEINVGVTRGRKYGKNLERPGFIHPSSEPLKASMEKQAQLKEEIRQLLKLTISNLRGPKMASAESKQEDGRSLESGLSYIGLALQNAEQKIAEFWEMYENNSQIATISYPKNYSLKSDEERRSEAKDLQEMLTTLPSKTYQKEIGKKIANITLGPTIPRESLVKIENEIDAAPTMTADPEIIAKDVEIGVLGLELASQIRGYPEGQVEIAAKEHADRLARIAESQANAQEARGVKDHEGNPQTAGKTEKKVSRDTTKDSVVKDKTRGSGK